MSLREEEIRRDDLFARYLELSARDIDRFFSDPASRAKSPCPGCGADEQEPEFTKHGFEYVRCPRCFSLFVSPRPSAASLDALYRDSPSSSFWAQEFYPAVAEARREKLVRPRVRRILDNPAIAEATGPARIIDAGAGAGVFLEEMRARAPEADLIGVEPGSELAEQARQRGLRIHEGPVADAADAVEPGTLVTSFEVIEHVHDPLEFLTGLWRLVAPGGTVLVTGLCGDGFDVQVLWEEAKAVSPPHHLNFLSVAGVEKVFERAGFAEVVVETPGQLDVEMVAKARAGGAELPRFLELLIDRRGANVHREFQRFLQDARLSSHVWAWGRRPVESA